MKPLLLSSTLIQVALSLGVVTAFVTLWLVLRRPAARAWASYWTSWLAANLLFYLVGLLRESAPAAAQIAPLVVAGSIAQFCSQVFLLTAVWLHTRPGPAWTRYRRATYAVMCLQFLSPAVVAFSQAPNALDIAQTLFRVSAVAPYALAIACFLAARHRTGMMPRRLALLALGAGLSRNLFFTVVALISFAAANPEALRAPGGAVFGWLGPTATFLLCLASLYLLLHDEAEIARILAAERVSDRRLVSLGRMAGALARDFGHVLTEARAGMSEAHTAATGGALDAAVGRITAAVSRGRERGGALLTYARDHQLRMEPLPLNAWLAREARAATWADRVPAHIDLQLSASDVIVRTDPAILRRVLAEVLDNACEALDGAGRVVLSTPSRLGRGGAVIRVADDGRGITPDVLPHATEPFFTTKGEGRAGLGLALCLTFVHQMGGSLRLFPNEPRGTVVEIELPVAR